MFELGIKTISISHLQQSVFQHVSAADPSAPHMQIIALTVTQPSTQRVKKPSRVGNLPSHVGNSHQFSVTDSHLNWAFEREIRYNSIYSSC